MIEGTTLLATDDQGRCVFLRDDGCSIHDTPDKPHTCHRFPLTLTTTPRGGRVSTDHRCPCRTMGERPLVDEAMARDALTLGGRLSADRRIEGRIPISKRRSVTFDRYVEIEQSLLAALETRGPDALESSPFPRLANLRWADAAYLIGADVPASRWGEGYRLFSQTLAVLTGAAPQPLVPRRLSAAFDRALLRSPIPRDPEKMLAEFAIDAIYGLEWTFRSSLDVARAELATRIAIARVIAQRLETEEGHRADRATAEAIACVELVGVGTRYSAIVELIEV